MAAEEAVTEKIIGKATKAAEKATKAAEKAAIGKDADEAKYISSILLLVKTC